MVSLGSVYMVSFSFSGIFKMIDLKLSIWTSSETISIIFSLSPVYGHTFWCLYMHCIVATLEIRFPSPQALFFFFLGLVILDFCGCDLCLVVFMNQLCEAFILCHIMRLVSLVSVVIGSFDRDFLKHLKQTNKKKRDRSSLTIIIWKQGLLWFFQHP